MADRGSGLPILDCNYDDYRLKPARKTHDDDVGSQTGSDCSVASNYLDWNLELPEQLHKVDNPGIPELMEGNVSQEKPKYPEGQKLYDAH